MEEIIATQDPENSVEFLESGYVKVYHDALGLQNPPFVELLLRRSRSPYSVELDCLSGGYLEITASLTGRYPNHGRDSSRSSVVQMLRATFTPSDFGDELAFTA